MKPLELGIGSRSGTGEVGNPEPSNRAHRKARLVYFVSHYPKLTETFIADEVRHLGTTFDVQVVPIVARLPNSELPPASVPDTRVVRESLWSLAVLRDTWRQCCAAPGKTGSLLAEILGEARCHPRTTLKSLLLVPRSLAIAFRLREHPVDVLYAGFASYPATMAWIVSRLSGTPFLFVAHANDIFKSHALLVPKCRDASAVLSISEFNRDYLLALDSTLHQTRFSVVPTGVDCSTLAFRPHRPSGAGITILSVGSLLEKKGHRTLIDAVSILIAEGVDVKCQIVGEGPERAALQQQIERLDLVSHVALVGGQARAAVHRLLEQADVFALASVAARDRSADGIPVALMEAMAVGVPVVSTRLRAIPELVMDEETGLLCEPGDAADIAASIVRLMNDDGLQGRLVYNARQHVEQHFDQGVIQSIRQEIVSQTVALGENENKSSNKGANKSQNEGEGS